MPSDAREGRCRVCWNYLAVDVADPGELAQVDASTALTREDVVARFREFPLSPAALTEVFFAWGTDVVIAVGDDQLDAIARATLALRRRISETASLVLQTDGVVLDLTLGEGVWEVRRGWVP